MKHFTKSTSNQSDKADYSSGSFSMGLSKLAKMKGIDKHASVFYLSIFLHMKVSCTIKFGGKKVWNTHSYKNIFPSEFF